MASIETIRCSNARALLSKVAPTADIFMHARDDSWLFRGQADSSWGLAPSAFREEEKLSRFAVRPDPAWSEWTNREQMDAEATAITTFMDESDRAGLPIP